MRNLFQLSDMEFDRLLDGIEVKAVKRKLIRQREFELEVAKRGWSLSENYVFVDNKTKVSLICDNQQTPHERKIQPTKFKSINFLNYQSL